MKARIQTPAKTAPHVVKAVAEVTAMTVVTVQSAPSVKIAKTVPSAHSARTTSSHLKQALMKPIASPHRPWCKRHQPMQTPTTCRRLTLIKTCSSRRIVMVHPLATATAKSAHVTAMAVNVTGVNAPHAATHLLRWNTVQPTAKPMSL